MTDEEFIALTKTHLHQRSVELIDSGMFAELKRVDPDAHQALWYMAQEIVRQREDEGWSVAHDDEHDEGQMAMAAACYAHLAGAQAKVNGRGKPGRIMTTAPSMSPPPSWPWDERWWKPKGINRNLIRAGALIAVEWGRFMREIPTLASAQQRTSQTERS